MWFGFAVTHSTETKLQVQVQARLTVTSPTPRRSVAKPAPMAHFPSHWMSVARMQNGWSVGRIRPAESDGSTSFGSKSLLAVGSGTARSNEVVERARRHLRIQIENDESSPRNSCPFLSGRLAVQQSTTSELQLAGRFNVSESVATSRGSAVGSR